MWWRKKNSSITPILSCVSDPIFRIKDKLLLNNAELSPGNSKRTEHPIHHVKRGGVRLTADQNN
jgi:hypothetical protein